MRLYIANPTKQHLIFNYRKPETRNTLSVQIAAGSQSQIEDDRLTKAQIDEIIAQNERYGLVPISQVGKSTRGGTEVPSMVFSIDKPIVVSKIFEALEAQDDMLRRRGDETRVNTAAGLQRALEESTDAEVTVLETEVVQIDAQGKPMDDPNAVHNGVTVKREGAPSERPPTRRRRAAK